jgi:hypothetical protein
MPTLAVVGRYILLDSPLAIYYCVLLIGVSSVVPIDNLHLVGPGLCGLHLYAVHCTRHDESDCARAATRQHCRHPHVQHLTIVAEHSTATGDSSLKHQKAS